MKKNMVAQYQGDYTVIQDNTIEFTAELTVNNYGINVKREYKHLVQVCEIYDSRGKKLTGGKVILRLLSMKEGVPVG